VQKQERKELNDLRDKISKVHVIVARTEEHVKGINGRVSGNETAIQALERKMNMGMGGLLLLFSLITVGVAIVF